MDQSTVSGLTGYNPDQVSASVSSVVGAYNNLLTAIGQNMQDQIVNGLADKWACPKAQEFFNNAFKPDVDALIASVNEIYSSVANAMNGAAQDWAVKNGETFSPVSFSPVNKTMDVSGILENIGGIRGIDLSQASDVANKLPVIASDAEEALQAARNAVDNCGFVGGNQATELQGSLDTIKTNVANTTNKLAADVKSYIDQTVQLYGDTAGKISQAFAGDSTGTAA